MRNIAWIEPLQNLAELYLLVVWTLDEEVSGSVIPEGDILNAVGNNLIAGILHLLVEGLYILYVQAEVVNSSVHHCRIVVGDEFDEEVAQLNEDELAAAGDVGPGGYLEAQSFVEADCTLNISCGQTYVLDACREGIHVESLLWEVLGYESLLLC